MPRSSLNLLTVFCLLTAGAVAEECTVDYKVLSYGGSVQVVRDGKPQFFARTDRGLGFVRQAYGIGAESLVGKRVLDIGTGDGKFVTDLRERGIDAVGVDIYLKPEQKAQAHFLEADAAKLPLENESVDRIFSSYSIYWAGYSRDIPDAVLLSGLREAARVLKPGGQLHFMEAETKRMKRLISEVPGLEIVEAQKMTDERTTYSVRKTDKSK